MLPVQQEQTNSVVTQQDQERLELTYTLRKKILDHAFAGEKVPTEARDIEVINGVLNSMDKAVYDNINARLKYQENQNKEAILEQVAETIKQIHSKSSNIVIDNRQVVVDDSAIPLDIVDGETSLQQQQVTLAEILSQGEQDG